MGAGQQSCIVSLKYTADFYKILQNWIVIYDLTLQSKTNAVKYI